MKNRSFKIITLGCKVNQYESAYLRESFLEKGLKEVSRNEAADYVIINTCTVTQEAGNQSRQAIRKAIRENPSCKAAAIGCYAKASHKDLSEISGLDLIAGTKSRADIPDQILSLETGESPRCFIEEFDSREPFEDLPIRRFMDRTRAFLKIQEGCRSYCSYCIVPYTRGPLRSMEPSKVLSMLQSFAGQGYREVVLTGIHVGKYGIDQGNDISLNGLLRLIKKEKLPLRIRISSLEPNEIDQELIGMVADEPWLCRHFHIPLQSGDDGILKKMNRTYGAEDFSRLIEEIHTQIPLAGIGVDVMVGFPGEDNTAFQNSFSLIKGLPISYLHVFPYSRREGTPAAKFKDQVSQDIKKERAKVLRELGLEKREAFYDSCIRKEFQVLTEGWERGGKTRIRGWSDNYLSVFFPSKEEINNRIVNVMIESKDKKGVSGKVAS